jgi:hypothetical protein
VENRVDTKFRGRGAGVELFEDGNDLGFGEATFFTWVS